MKVLIASDIHGSATAAALLAQRIDEFCPDTIVLLGDLLYHGPRNDLPQGYAPKQVIPILNGYKDRILAVRGNCEAEVDQTVLEFPCMEGFAWLDLDGRRLFATHGHLWETSQLPDYGSADVIASGHTHIKVLERRNGTIYLNPGSTSIPKDGAASYATYCDGEFALHAMDGAVLKRLR